MQSGTFGTSFSYSFPAPGNYLIYFYQQQYDQNGDSTTYDPVTNVPLAVTVTPPVVYTVSPTTICQGDQVCLNFSSLPAIYNINPTNTVTDFGDGSQCSNCGPNLCHNYANVGTYDFLFSYGFNYDHLLSGDPYTGYCGVDKHELITVNPVQVSFTQIVNCDGTTHFTAAPNACVKPGATYNWNFGDGQTSTSQNPVHIYTQLGNYNVNLTLTNPGGIVATYSATVSVTSLACCGSNPNGTNPINFLPATAQTISSNFTFNGATTQTYTNINYTIMPNVTLTIPSGKDVTFQYCTFLMYQGSKIVITGANTNLMFISCHLFGCSQLWEGIVFGTSGASQNNTLTMNRTEVEDALVAVNAPAVGNLAAKALITNCLFNRNADDIKFKNSNANASQAGSFSVQKSVFTCRSLTYNPPYAVFPGILNAVSFYNTVLAPAATAIVKPHPTLPTGLIHSQTGISLYGQDHPNNLDIETNVNLYERHVQGINTDKVSLTVRKQYFYNMNTLKSGTLVPCGIFNNGVPTNVVQTPTSLTIGGTANTFANYFNNCDNGIYSQNRTSHVIKRNVFNVGTYGVRIDNNNLPANTTNTTIQNNTLTDIRRSAFFFTNNNGIFASVGFNTVGFSSTAAQTLTSRGVEIAEFNQPANAKYYVSSNTFNNVYEGIDATNVNGMQVSTNTVTLHSDVACNNFPNCNFNQAIGLNNSINCVIQQNNVIGTANANAYWEGGLFAGGGANNDFHCNNVDGTFSGIGFNGQSAADVYKNDINNVQFGVWLNQGAIIGAQDNPNYPTGAQPSDNRWTNIGQYYSISTNTTFSTASNPFYVRSNAPFNMPLLLNFADGTSTPMVPQTPTGINLPYFNSCLGGGGQKILNIANRIALNQLYPQNMNALRSASEKELYSFLKATNYNTSGNPTLASFKNNTATNNTGKFYDVDVNIKDGFQQQNITLLQNAANDNSSLVSSDNVEALQKQVNTIFIGASLNGNTYITGDLNTLRSIAVLCPYTDGIAVFQARAILSSYDSTQYINPCEFSLPAVSGSRLAQPVSAEVIDNEITTRIFPNPSNGSITIAVNGKAAKIEVEIVNLIGDKVLNQVFDISSTGEARIENLNAGVYVVRLIVDGVFKNTHRLVITK